MKACYLEVNGKPWCEISSMAFGCEIALKTRVVQCSYTRKGDAKDAAKRLRRFFKRGKVKVIEGYCPA